MRSSARFSFARGLVAPGILAAALASGAIWGEAGDTELGQRIYREGILPSGQELRAVSLQSVNLRGEKAACITCHRRSGFGSSEGYKPVRPITGRYLFQTDNAPPQKLSGNPASPRRGLRLAYNERTLARVLRTGIDAAGRKLDAMMPRYQLDDADIGHLAAYLKTLSIEPDPGVSATTLHFATIVDTAADPEQRQAMLEIIETFFRDKNAGTRLEGERARRAPWDMAREYKAYRKWQLHVWALEGSPETWSAQLEAHYRAQPVFAVLSGIGAGTWQPVHDFCERTEVPCIFPNVDQPPQTPGQYTLYLSRGLAMEAEALAAHLARSRTMERIVQVYRDGTTGVAEAFSRALKAADLPPPETRKVISAAPPDAGFWRELVKAQPDVLVLWLKSEDLAALGSLPQSVRQMFLSARLADLSALPTPLAQRAALVYPWELPQRLAPRLQRLHAWLRMKRIKPRDDTIQADTFFAVSQAGMEVQHLVDDYSRDYFIELIEHGLDNALSPSSYPSPTLAPGQRYASKGSYIVKAAGNGRQQLEPVGDWIVPDLLPGAPRQ